jgi:predicted Zn-dependent protease
MAQWRGAGLLEEGTGWREVAVELAGGHLGVMAEGAAPRWWAVKSIGNEGGGRFLLEGGVRLLVTDMRLGALLEAAPRAKEEKLWPKAAALAGVAAALGWFMWRVAVPGLGELLVRSIPVESERKLGEAIVAAFGAGGALERDEAAQGALARMTARLESGFEGSAPYTFTARLYCVDELNAAAAPGGFILVLDGLVKRLETPEQMAAILAHEMEHVALRHGLRALARRSALQIGFGLLLGDVTSVAALAAAELTNLGYSREDEMEADREGLRLMARAGYDPRAMVQAFEVLERDEAKRDQGPEYLRTHPLAGERREALEREMGELRRGPEAEVDESGWAALKGACGGQGRVRRRSGAGDR